MITLLNTTEISYNIFKNIVIKKLASLNYGCIELVDDQDYLFGDTNAVPITIKINQPSFYRRVCLHGSLGFAEAYIDKDFDCDNLEELLIVFVRNYSSVSKVDYSWLNYISLYVNKIKYILMPNNRYNAIKHIYAHYDISNDFFKLFLDEDMMYSSAMYDVQHNTLATASKNKITNILNKLQLDSDSHLLEIGSGWGAVAIAAAQQYGCQVTTTTISQQQYNYVVAKVKDLGLDKKITVLQQDYRDLRGTYDRIVSIEMIEAVGSRYYPVYFKKCSSLLTPTGIFVMQAILIRDNQYERAKYEVDYIKKYIFPGSCIPSTTSLMQNIALTDLVLQNCEDITASYVLTLRAWLANFNAKLSEVKLLGFDERFIRIWQYYLEYCAAGFASRHIMDHQYVFTKPEYQDVSPNI